MKLMINVNLTLALGFLKGNGFVSGKKMLGFFGLREHVSFPFINLNLHFQHL